MLTPAAVASALIKLGKSFSAENDSSLEHAVRKAAFENAWFTEENVRYALHNWSRVLREENISRWMEMEAIDRYTLPHKVGLIMAGNVPLVGLHDLLSVIVTGNHALVKLSKDDDSLMRYAIQTLVNSEPELSQHITVIERLESPDAVIATGSNNTARYFEYYFGKYPNIIRKNRNSAAILTGEESVEDLHQLGFDIFRYFGLGCRNVTRLYLPRDYNIPDFFDGIAHHYKVIDHSRYANNYTYHKAILLMNLHKHYDNNFLLLKQESRIYSPIGCLNYDFYESRESLDSDINANSDNLQILVSKNAWYPGSLPFGESQKPALWDYADRVNTVAFCKSLN